MKALCSVLLVQLLTGASLSSAEDVDLEVVHKDTEILLRP